jgi:SAM-dependent methyltransferase
MERSPARLRAHYDIELELAARLRNAPRSERLGLYGPLYDELFRRVPDHPQLTQPPTSQDRQQAVERQMRLLEPFLTPQATVIEVGPGDCALSRRLCERVRQVIGVDVSAEITQRTKMPENFALHLSDGVTVPGPSRGVELIYSHQLMEHLHPDDAADQLGHIVERLAPGGAYVCVTPNRLSGPHDISRHFDEAARGFHLREYTASELMDLFRAAGFSRAGIMATLRGRTLMQLPAAVVRRAEARAQALPPMRRRALWKWPPWRWLDTVCVVGYRAA